MSVTEFGPMSRPTLSIELVSDLICPWCYVGLVSLSRALQELHLQHGIQIQWRPLELFRPSATLSAQTVIDKVKGVIESRALLDFSQQLGIKPMDPSVITLRDTRPAHRLLYQVNGSDNPIALALSLFEAYFYGQRDIANLSLLTDSALHCGLSEDTIAQQIDSHTTDSAIDRDAHRWHQDGITSVPAYVVNEKFVIHGAQSPEKWIQALTRLYDKVPSLES